jgi:hypothetical protein
MRLKIYWNKLKYKNLNQLLIELIAKQNKH